jgi:hypothetical protein
MVPGRAKGAQASGQTHVRLVNAVLVGGGVKTMSRRWQAVSDTYDQEKPRITESARNAPSIKDQARQAEDAAASQYGNDSQSDGSGERYGATRY